MRWRNIIIVAVVLVLLGGAYYFAVNFEPTKAPQPTTAPVESITVYQVDSKTVDRLVVKNTDGEYVFVKNGSDWAVEGKDFVKPVSAKVSTLAYTASYVTAVNIIEDNAAELSKYGLTQPQATLSVRSDGAETVFLLGDKTPADNYYYFMVSGKNTVYTVSQTVGDVMLSALDSYRNMEVVNVDSQKVRAIEVNNGKTTIAAQYTPLEEGTSNDYGTLSVWTLTSPVRHSASNDSLNEKLIKPSCAINADSIAADNPTDMSAYNLNGSVHITLEDGTSVSYKVGSANGLYYAMPENSTSVFVVPKTAMEFLNVTAMDVVERFIVLHNIEKISGVSVETPKISGALTIENGDTKSYYLDGGYASEEGFKSMYQVIIGLAADGIMTHEYDSSTPLATVSYTIADGSTDIITLYPYDELNAAIVYRGESVFYMKKSAITELENSLGKLKENPTQRVKPQ